MESSKEIKILDDLNINYTDLVNSTLDVFEDCSLVINSSNIEKLNNYVREGLNKKAKLIITSIIDNLLKGASGQAVQNMNIKYNFNQYEGLK